MFPQRFSSVVQSGTTGFYTKFIYLKIIHQEIGIKIVLKIADEAWPPVTWRAWRRAAAWLRRPGELLPAG